MSKTKNAMIETERMNTLLLHVSNIHHSKNTNLKVDIHHPTLILV